MLDELRFADRVDNEIWGDVLTAQDLVEMVTVNAARALGLDDQLGSIEVGTKADLMVIGGDAGDPWGAMLKAHPRDVRLVLVGGVALYGDAVLEQVAPESPGCEKLEVCCGQKFLCVAEDGGAAGNKLAQTYGEMLEALGRGLEEYDAMDVTEYRFAPVAPLFSCSD